MFMTKFFFIKFFFIEKKIKLSLVLLKFFIKNLLSFYAIYVRKLSFVGKSYKLIYDPNYLNLHFNKANINYLFPSTSVVFRYVSKQKILILSLKQKTSLELNKLIKSVRKQNIFTGRGLKISKSMVFKKKGKVSSYSTQSTQF